MSTGSPAGCATPNIPLYEEIDDSHNAGGPAPTSRTSVSRIFSVVEGFDDYKKNLVQEIGFGGILLLPNITRINLRFSRWIMSKVDPAAMCILLDQNRSIRFWEADVHKVFGIPCGTLDINSPDSLPNEQTVKFMRAALGMPEKGGLLLKCAELILSRPLSEKNSSNLEKECFQMAFVIFVMGHLLAPSTKHDYTTIDYWGAICKPNRIADFNWCNYVIKDLLSASQQVRADIQNNRPVTHLYGCHVFLQVFYLDNLNLGLFNLPHKELPRIASFDEVKFRRMILFCSSSEKDAFDYSCAPIRNPEQICYTRSTWDTPADNLSEYNVGSKYAAKPSSSMPPPIIHRPPTVAQTTNRSNSPLSAPSSATDFSKYLHNSYPAMATHELGLLLKRHNAVGAQQYSSLKSSIINENTKFLDSVMQILSKNCVCCSLRSLPCIIQRAVTTNIYQRHTSVAESDDDSTSSSAIPATSRQHLNQIESPVPKKKYKGSAATSSHNARTVDDLPGYTTPEHAIIRSRSAIDTAQTWAETIVSGIVLFNDDQHTPSNDVLISDTSEHVHMRAETKHTLYASDHWTMGVLLPKPSISVLVNTERYMANISQEVLHSPWITHLYPRFISVTGYPILDQLVRDASLDHEICSLIIRSLRQIDKLYLYKNSEDCFRHYFDADFSTTVLAGAKIVDNISVQQQFIGDHISYNIANCRLFIVPVMLQTGWCAYVWDMERKLIWTIDPMAVCPGYALKRKVHEAVADKLHIAIFTCLYKFFSSWHVDCTNWKKKFEIFTMHPFSQEESGIGMIQMMRNFHASGLKSMPTKETLKLDKTTIITEILRLSGNSAKVPTELHCQE